MIKALHVSQDNVIRSAFVAGHTSFGYALEKIHPLLDRFEPQRKAQNKKFYDRLRADIVKGCIMPPITLAFLAKDHCNETNNEKLQNFINGNIEAGYILDGMLRMITLRDASELQGFDASRTLYLNVIVASRYDLLLYRMITLNNGQKPMTARHQIEMLTKGAIDLSGADMTIVTEKQTEGTKVHNAFRMSDISEAYTAYLSNSPHNQNSKIIESKLDDILVGKVMEANITEDDFSFSDILAEISRLQNEPHIRDWLRQLNNLIGFTLGAKTSLESIKSLEGSDLINPLKNFEAAFDAINPSKVNVGKYRRELSQTFFRRIDQLIDWDEDQLSELFFEETMTE